MESPTRRELAKNIRRVLRKMSRRLPLTPANSSLIDLINHADTLAQQLEAQDGQR